jgi:hypothetical protein
MDTYISGDGIEPNKERAANSFLDAVNSDMESLKIRAIVKDSVFLSILLIRVMDLFIIMILMLL